MGAVEDALAPVRAMLAAEDYHLTVDAAGGGAIRLTVAAGAQACSYCLVPKATLTAIARRHLADAGLPDDGDIEMVYPDDVGAGAP